MRMNFLISVGSTKHWCVSGSYKKMKFHWLIETSDFVTKKITEIYYLNLEDAWIDYPSPFLGLWRDLFNLSNLMTLYIIAGVIYRLIPWLYFIYFIVWGIIAGRVLIEHKLSEIINCLNTNKNDTMVLKKRYS